MLNRLRRNPELRFCLPVIYENVATVFIGLVFSSIVGGISVSSLAAVGLVNTILNVLTAFSSFLAIGSTALTARLVGAGDRDSTALAIEQSLLIAIVFGCTIMVLGEITAVPIMHALLPNSEESVLLEGLTYYRTLLLSFPLLLLNNTLSGVMRAAGESKPAMHSAILMNIIQILSAYVLISCLKMEVVGAGLAYVICRLFGAGLMMTFCLRSHRHFSIRLRRVFIPVKSMLWRIARLGLPSSLESVSVQLGYLLMNSLAMSLGTLEASAYQVCNTLQTFPVLPQSIGSVVAVTIVGQALGAGNLEAAKRKRYILNRLGLLISLVLGVLVALLGPLLTPLYNSDPYVQKRGTELLWLMTMFYMPGLSINVNDPVLRTGGDTKSVMLYTTLSVWLIRLPLSLLFCYPMNMGAAGVVLANVVSVVARAVFGDWRIRRGKWLYMKV